MTSTPECCAEKAAPISSKASVKEAAANITNGIPRGARSAEDPSVDGWVQLAANPSIRSTQINLSARGARIRAPPLAGTLCGFGCANLPPCGPSSCQPREPIEHGTRLVNAERKQNLPKVIIAGCGGRRGASFELFEAHATHLALCREQALNTRQVQQFEEAQFRQKDNPYGAQRRHRLTQPGEKALAPERRNRVSSTRGPMRLRFQVRSRKPTPRQFRQSAIEPASAGSPDFAQLNLIGREEPITVRRPAHQKSKGQHVEGEIDRRERGRGGGSGRHEAHLFSS